MKMIFFSIGATVLAGSLCFSSGAPACDQSEKSTASSSKGESCGCGEKDHKSCGCSQKGSTKEEGKSCSCKMKSNKS